MSDFGNAPPPPERPYGQEMPQPPGGMPPIPDQAGGPRATPSRPPAIGQAVMLMRVGAVLSVVTALVSLTSRQNLRDFIEEQVSKQGSPISASDVDVLVNVALVSAFVTGLLGAALWLWMAWANGRGAAWARIVATILFGFSLLSALLSVFQPQSAASRLLDLAEVLLGAYIIFLLYRRESTEFYRARSAPRY
jgi:hypothetical protein